MVVLENANPPSRVLERISQGNSIEITQAGEPVAVILSASEYQRLTASKSTFWTSLQEFYSYNDLEDFETEADVFANVRDRCDRLCQQFNSRDQ